MSDKLAAATHMGAVTLKVGDLDAMIRYYTEAVPLQLLSHAGPTATLGRGGVPDGGRGDDDGCGRLDAALGGGGPGVLAFARVELCKYRAQYGT